MHQYWLFALLGLGSGAIYATVALGLVMMHRASGVINFAHGALALYAIYAYIDLRNTGRLILPVLGVPAVDLGAPFAFVPALLLAVAATVLLGSLAYLLVFRQLEDAPVLAKIVATVGLLVAIAGQLEVEFPSQSSSPLVVPQILPHGAVSILGAVIPQDGLWLSGLALVTAGALAWMYRFTAFGLVTAAAASSTKGVVLLGRDPRRVALGNWALASALAAVFGVLVAPSIPIAPNSVVLLVVPSLAAASLAGFRSVMVAACAGLMLGVLESVLVSVQTDHPSLPQGLETIGPLLIIITVAFLRGHTTVRRNDLAQDRLPRSPEPRHIARTAVVGVTGTVVALVLTSGDIRLGLIVSLMGAAVCLSIVLLTGYVGQISLMQVAFTGLSGLLLAGVATGAGIPFPLAPIVAILGAGALGLVIGIPALRVRGTSLAVATLSAGVATEQLIFGNSALAGGVEGHPVSAPKIFGLDLNILGGDYPRKAFGLFVLFVVALLAAGVANLRRSPTGLQMLAVRTNERAAASSGINSAQTKLFAFTLSAAIAGSAGVLFAYQQVRFAASSFGVLTSLIFLAWAYVGGITSVSGAFIAGALVPGGILTALANTLFNLGDYQTLSGGLLVMVAAVLAPEGLAGRIRLPERFGEAAAAALRRSRVRPHRPGEAGGRWGQRERQQPAQPAGRARPVKPTGRTGSAAALTVQDVSVHYGKLRAVERVTFTVLPGEIVAVIGPNGAGKTSLVDALSGFATLANGSVRLGDVDVSLEAPHQRARRGLARTWQSGELFEDLTARQNLLVASESRGPVAMLADVVRPKQSARDNAVVTRLLTDLELGSVADRLVTDIPQDKRKLVSIGRALAGDPQVLLLDEPAAGLNTDETGALGDVLRQTADAGMAIVLIDHDVNLVFSVCDRVVVMDFGQQIAYGPASEVANDPAVVTAYLGHAATPAPEAQVSA